MDVSAHVSNKVNVDRMRSYEFVSQARHQPSPVQGSYTLSANAALYLIGGRASIRKMVRDLAWANNEGLSLVGGGHGCLNIAVAAEVTYRLQVAEDALLVPRGLAAALPPQQPERGEWIEDRSTPSLKQRLRRKLDDIKTVLEVDTKTYTIVRITLGDGSPDDSYQSPRQLPSPVAWQDVLAGLDSTGIF